jgi:hypothetical protein
MSSSTFSSFSPCLRLFLLLLLLHVFFVFFFFFSFSFLKRCSLLRTLAFNTIFLHSDDLWAFPASFYSHYICFLQPSLSIYCVAFIFFMFLPLWLLQSVVAFFGFAFFHHDHSIPVAGTFFNLPGTELGGFSITVQSIER